MSEEKIVQEEAVETVEEVMEKALPNFDGPIMTMKKLMEAGVHFGHQTKKWNPKTKKFIYTARNGFYVIDLSKSCEALCEAYVALKKIVEENGKVVFVGTKKNAQEIVKEEALRSGSFYVTTRWLGGTLTNFRTLKKSIDKLKRLEAMEESGEFFGYTKKEVAEMMKTKEKLEKDLGGIKEMMKIPQAIFVVDPKEEINAILEAKKLRIPVFGICNTNSDPELLDYAIPGNDVGTKSIKLLVTAMADAVVQAKGGMPEVAYIGEEEEVTMTDALAIVDRVEEAKQLARQAALKAKREAFLAQQQRRATTRRPRKTEEKPAEAPKAEEVKEEVVEEAPKAE